MIGCTARSKIWLLATATFLAHSGSYATERPWATVRLLTPFRRACLQKQRARDRKTIRIDCVVTVPEGVVLPLVDMARKLSEHAGLRVVSEGDSDYALSIVVKGEALGASYFDGHHYSGARLSGSISMKTSTARLSQNTIRVERKPPSVVSGRSPTPAQAPFRDLLYEEASFLHQMVRLFGDVMGTDVLLSSLASAGKHDAVFSHLAGTDMYAYWAAEELRRLKDPRAVPPLIEMLRLEFPLQRGLVLEAVDILGEFGDRRAAKPLLEFLKSRHHDGYSWQKTVESAARCGDEALIGLADRLVGAADWEKEIIATTLRKTTKQDFGTDPVKWKEWFTRNKR